MRSNQGFYQFHRGKCLLSGSILFLATQEVTLSFSPFVHPFVRPLVHSSVPFFSFSVLGVLFIHTEFQWCFNKVLRVFQVSRVFQGKFKDVSSTF